MKYLIKYIFVLCFCFVVFILNSPETHAAVSDSYLQKIIDHYNQTLPRQISPEMRQEKSIILHGEIMYRYTIVSMTGIAISNRIAESHGAERRATCQDELIQSLLKRGITVNYIYYGSDGSLGGSIKYTARICGY
jgi:hypothetical protein